MSSYFGHLDSSIDDDLEERLHNWIEKSRAPEDTSADSLEELHKKIKWVRSSISHHTARLGGPWLPPTLPFLLTFDPRTRIFAISFANLLCIDIDEKDGCDKTTAAEVVERYAKSHGLTFRLLETDRGMHAYCTSRTFDPRESETWEMMRNLKCDLYYIAFSTFRGFSYRLSPKFFDSDETRELQVQKKKQDFDHEFVQREWSQKIVGPESGEDPALVSMVNLTLELTRYIKSIPNLWLQVSWNLCWDWLLRDICNFAKNEYMKLLEQPGPSTLALHLWMKSSNTMNLQYMNDLMDWQPCKNPQHLRAKTADGKTIVIYHHEATARHPEGGWYFVHAEKHRGPFESQRAAKNAVAETFRGQMPKNVEMALLNDPGECPHWTVWMVRHVDLEGANLLRLLWCLMGCFLVLLMVSLVVTSRPEQGESVCVDSLVPGGSTSKMN